MRKLSIVGALLALAACEMAEAPMPQALQLDRGWFMIFFNSGSAETQPAGRNTIRQIANAANALDLNRLKILISAHADTDGDSRDKLALSCRYADALSYALIELGLDVGRIVVRGYGDTKPLVQTGRGVAEAQNRRAEILVGGDAPAREHDLCATIGVPSIPPKPNPR